MDPATAWRTTFVCNAWDASAKVGQGMARFNDSIPSQSDRDDIIALFQAAEDYADSTEGQLAFGAGAVHSQLTPRLNNLKMLRNPLTPGTYAYSEELRSGGAIKFHAESYNGAIHFGTWGWYIDAGQTGEIVIPIDAAAGAALTAASIRLDLLTTNSISSIQIIAIDADGGETVIADSVAAAQAWAAVPPASLGDAIKFKIRIHNSSTAQQRMVWTLSMNLTVEPLAAPIDCADVIAMGYRLDGDLDGNCTVDINDFASMASLWLATCGTVDCGAADTDDSGVVDLSDFAVLADTYGSCNRPGESGCITNW